MNLGGVPCYTQCEYPSSDDMCLFTLGSGVCV